MHYPIFAISLISWGGVVSRRARNLPNLQRHAPKRSSYDRVLIVCEGSKTEPNYFNEIIDDLKLNFEYWLLLHFTYTTKPYAPSENRSSGGHVEHELKQYLPDYEKGSKQIYKQIMPHTDRAIIYAKRANAEADKANTDNPSTQVYLLVEYLRDLKDQKKHSG